jgi:hypothetical protein
MESIHALDRVVVLLGLVGIHASAGSRCAESSHHAQTPDAMAAAVIEEEHLLDVNCAGDSNFLVDFGVVVVVAARTEGLLDVHWVLIDFVEVGSVMGLRRGHQEQMAELSLVFQLTAEFEWNMDRRLLGIREAMSHGGLEWTTRS